MLAESGRPFDSPAHLFDAKWDGLRSIAFFGPTIHLQARSLRNQTPQFPDLVRALAALPGSGVLDGEIVVLEDAGDSPPRASFNKVMERNRQRTEAAARRAAAQAPAGYCAFDLLAQDGVSLVGRPLAERRRALDALLPGPRGAVFPNPCLPGAGLRFFSVMREQRMEGMVGKRLSSRYRIGERSGAWLKIKIRPQHSCVVFGTLHAAAGGAVRSLVVGAWGADGAVWLGNVGSGLDEATRARLRQEVPTLEAPPPPGFHAEGDGVIHYLRPLLVARVEYLEVTPGGRLRHPSFIGFEDRNPRTCRPPAGG